MSIDVPPPPELAKLFDGERDYEEVPDRDARARMLAGIRLRIAPPGGGGEPGGSGPGPAGGVASSAASIATRTALAGMIATFLIGALLGAAVMRLPTSAPVEAAAVRATAAASVVTSPSSSTAASPSENVLELPATSPPAPLPSAARPVPAVESTDDASSAAAERALLDGARIALASGDPTQALDVAARHAREYPRGRLAEEREAIAVRALVKAGRYDEARLRGARFESLYPRSVAAPAVDAAIRSIP